MRAQRRLRAGANRKLLLIFLPGPQLAKSMYRFFMRTQPMSRVAQDVQTRHGAAGVENRWCCNRRRECADRDTGVC